MTFVVDKLQDTPVGLEPTSVMTRVLPLKLQSVEFSSIARKL